LLVDDEAILLMSLKQSLRLHFGSLYRNETALDGSEGLDRIRELGEEGIEIVLVISDWLMPGMKGDKFLAIVHERYPSIKLAEAVKLEAFIRKPWSPQRLFQIIEASLGTR
jgi:CheY-like chemotaxis protein